MAKIIAPQHDHSNDARHPEDEFLQAILDSPAAPSGALTIKPDGKLHRYAVEGDKGTDKSGYYKFYPDGLPAGFFGNWKSGGFHQNWHAAGTFSVEEWAEYTRRMEEIEADRQIEEAKRKAEAANTAFQMGQSFEMASPEHPYLLKKKVEPHGIFQTTGEKKPRLAIPVFVNGQLTSWQFIDAAGHKQYMGGGEVKGGCFLFGTQAAANASKKLFIGEGYATCAAIFEATGIPTLSVFSANNLTPVAEWARATFGPGKDIVIVADNDDSGTGQREAKKAAAVSGARIIEIPVAGMDANDYKNSGRDLKEVLDKGRPWLTALKSFIAHREPIEWLIENWLPKKGLGMVIGDPGTGKTFLVLDWVMHIAAGLADWCGNAVTRGNVVYLLGEGHVGMIKRVDGWLQHHGISPDNLNVWFSESATDLNKPDGLTKVLTNIRGLGVMKIDCIIVDTLNRHLLGDENSAQDTRTMLTNCDALQKAFDCGVLFVHHTGVSPDAKNRARGSSAWLGALDMQVHVKTEKTSAGNVMTITQMKQKDIELMDPIKLKMEKIDVAGRYKKDGTVETTLILQPYKDGEAPVENAESQKLQRAVHVFSRAALDRVDDEYSCSQFDPEDGTLLGIKTSSWFTYFNLRYETKDGTPARKDTVKKSFERTKKLLIDEDYITENGDMCLPTDRWKSEGRGLQIPWKRASKTEKERQQSGNLVTNRENFGGGVDSAE